MTLLNSPLLILALALGILYHTTTYLRARRLAAAFAKAHNCAPIARLPQTERIIGWGVIRQLRANAKANTRLEWFTNSFRKHGSTFKVTVFGEDAILTEEPENIKHVLATGFLDFGLGHREKAFGPLLGAGIFDTG